MYKLQSLKIKNIISFKNQQFEFRNGKAIIIIGENLDDSSQKGNGSGKSSLIESIALAFTGCSLRDVKTKELIYNGEKDGEVELVMVNTQTGKEFNIWRKLYANTTSAEYAAWIDGKEQSDRYSDFNSFNAFVFETIGISKEDFFNFFLITKENYSPFLTVGDVKKKEIINRFSGADKVDNTFPLIEEDSDAIATEIAQIDRELLRNTTKQELVAGQLIEEENKVSEEGKNELIAAKEAELGDLMLGVEQMENAVIEAKKELDDAIENGGTYQLHMEDSLKPFKSDVKDAELAVSEFQFSKDYNAELFTIELEKQVINKKVTDKKAELPALKAKFQPEIDAILKDETDTKAQLAEDQQTLKEFETFESEVNKNLLDAIECPMCSHKFLLRDKEFNVEEAKAQLPEVQENIKDLKELIAATQDYINTDIQAQKLEVNKRIIAVNETIKTDLDAFNQHLIKINAMVHELQSQQQEEQQKKQLLVSKVSQAKQVLKNKEQEEQNALTSLKNVVRRAELSVKQAEQELTSHLEQCEALENQIETLRAQDLDRSKVEKLERDIAALVKEEEKIKLNLEAKRKEKESIDIWEQHFKSFKSHLANKSILNIEEYTNLFLQNMNSNLTIAIDGYKTLANKKLKEQITTSVKRDGFDAGSYGKFSGGERGRIDLATICAMQELINVQVSEQAKGIDFLCVDEILESVDTEGLECMINSLQPIGKTIMIVSQQPINALADYCITIQKKNKVSHILN